MVSVEYLADTTRLSHQFGTITYDRIIETADINLWQEVIFTPYTIEVHPNTTPPIGTALNHPARIHLYSLSNNLAPSSPDMKIISNNSNGVIFDVPHFTKYGMVDVFGDTKEQMPVQNTTRVSKHFEEQNISSDEELAVEDDNVMDVEPSPARKMPRFSASIDEEWKEVKFIQPKPAVKKYQPHPNRLNERFSVPVSHNGQITLPKIGDQIEVHNLAKSLEVPSGTTEILQIHRESCGQLASYDEQGLPVYNSLTAESATGMWKQIPYAIYHGDIIHNSEKERSVNEAVADAWLLLNALFGDPCVDSATFFENKSYAQQRKNTPATTMKTQSSHKEAFLNWLRLVNGKELNDRIQEEEDFYKRIVYYLSADQTEEAMKACEHENKYYLCTIIAQTQTVTLKNTLQQMMDSYRNLRADKSNVPEGLDWLFSVMLEEKQANLNNWRLTLGIISWIVCEQNDEIKDIFERFNDSYFESESPVSLFKPTLKDINYLLLDIFVKPLECMKADTYANSHYRINLNNIRDILNPLSHFHKNMNLHSWLFYESLRVIYTNSMFLLTDPEMQAGDFVGACEALKPFEKTGVQLAEELELQGHWEWAIYVLLHVNRQAVGPTLRRNIALYNTSSEYIRQECKSKIKFLMDNLGFLPEYIANVLGDHAVHSERFDKAIKQYITARNHNEVGGILIHKVGPDYIVKYRGTQLYTKLKEGVIDKIWAVEYSYKMTLWTQYTAVFDEYCCLSAEFESTEVVEAHLPKLADLAKQIDKLPASEFLQQVAYAIMQEQILLWITSAEQTLVTSGIPQISHTLAQELRWLRSDSPVRQRITFIQAKIASLQ